VVGGRERHHAGDQGRGQSRVARQRAHESQDPVGIDAGGVHGEGREDDDYPQRQHPALRKRLRADVDPPEHGDLAAAQKDRVSALGREPVDHDHEDAKREPPPKGGGERAARAGREPGDADGRARAEEDQRARAGERDHRERAEVERCGERADPAERARAGRVCDRRPHRGSGSSAPSATATA
jgi:hypothetical protein